MIGVPGMSAVHGDGQVTFATPQPTISLSTIDDKAVKMATKYKVGDHVTWNSEAGRVGGTITKIHTSDFKYKGYPRHASADVPQYEIKSHKTDHVAAHKGAALTLTSAKK